MVLPQNLKKNRGRPESLPIRPTLRFMRRIRWAVLYLVLGVVTTLVSTVLLAAGHDVRPAGAASPGVIQYYLVDDSGLCWSYTERRRPGFHEITSWVGARFPDGNRQHVHSTPTQAHVAPPSWSTMRRFDHALDDVASKRIVDRGYGWPMAAMYYTAQDDQVSQALDLPAEGTRLGPGPHLPRGIIGAGFGINTGVFALGWMIVMGVPRAGVYWRRRLRGCCPRCAYDLRDDLKSGCPECGWRRTEPQPVAGDA